MRLLVDVQGALFEKHDAVHNHSDTKYISMFEEDLNSVLSSEQTHKFETDCIYGDSDCFDVDCNR